MTDQCHKGRPSVAARRAPSRHDQRDASPSRRAASQIGHCRQRAAVCRKMHTEPTDPAGVWVAWTRSLIPGARPSCFRSAFGSRSQSSRSGFRWPSLEFFYESWSGPSRSEETRLAAVVSSAVAGEITIDRPRSRCHVVRVRRQPDQGSARTGAVVSENHGRPPRHRFAPTEAPRLRSGIGGSALRHRCAAECVLSCGESLMPPADRSGTLLATARAASSRRRMSPVRRSVTRATPKAAR
jgi:hypothetical protein